MPITDPSQLPGYHAAYDTLAANSLFTDTAGTTPASVSGSDRVRCWKPSASPGGGIPNMTDGNGAVYVVEGGVPTAAFTPPQTSVLEGALSGGEATRTAFTAYFVVRRLDWNSTGTRLGYFRVPPSARQNLVGFNASTGGLAAVFEANLGNLTFGVGGTPDTSWHVYALSYSAAGGFRGFVDGGEVSPNYTTSQSPQAEPAGAITSFAHGGYAIGAPQTQDQATVALYGYTAAHTPAQVRDMVAYLRARFAALIGSASNPAVVWTGASNFMDVATTAGGNQVVKTSVPWKVLQNSGKYGRHHWGARPSIRTDQARTRITDEIARYLALYTGTVVVCHYAGGNDVGIGGGTAADIYAALTGLVADLHALGSTVKVVLGTYLPRTGLDNAVRATLNTLIRANSAGADAVADWAANATIGPDGANSNTTYYQTDGIHLIDAGTTVGYPYWMAQVNRLLTPAPPRQAVTGAETRRALVTGAV